MTAPSIASSSLVQPALPDASPDAPPDASGDGSPVALAAPRNRATAWRGFLLAAILLGLGLRFVLAAVSWGTNDANTFGQFGFYITRDGLISTYQNDVWLNHPPIPSYWSEAAWRLTIPFKVVYDPVERDTRLLSEQITPSTPGRYFSAVFKIPALLADCATAWLLYRLWRERSGETRALAVTAMYAWSLNAILVSGYHCNTDPIYAFFCLLCAYLLQDRKCHFLGGLALAAAINIKLTPILLILPLLFWHRSWQSATKFLLGLAIGALPFVPVLMYAGKSFYANAIAYKSNPDNWGITCLLMQADKEPGESYEFVPKEHPLAGAYFNYGRYAVLALIAGWAVLARSRRQAGGQNSRPLDAYTIAAVTLSIFLFFTPGFGVQYTVMVVPLLFAVWPGMASAYGCVAGLFLGVVYWSQWPGHHWPPSSQFAGMFPRPTRVYGLAAWGLLGYFLLRVVRARSVGIHFPRQ